MVTSNPTNLGRQKVHCSGSMGLSPTWGAIYGQIFFLGPKKCSKLTLRCLSEYGLSVVLGEFIWLKRPGRHKELNYSPKGVST